MNILRRATLAVLSAACLITWTARAEIGLEISLVPEVTSIKPGQPFYVGLFVQHEKGWHTYWKQPGVVGVPIDIAWKLPKEFTAGELEFPEPQRVLMYQIKAQGYERDVLVACKITPPATLPDGATITLAGKASWMCCANTCHPGFKDLTLDLKVKKEGGHFDPAWRPVFERERATFPRCSDAWTAEAVQDAKTVTLTLKPASGAARKLTAEEAAKIIFFTEDGWIHTDLPQTVEMKPDGRIVMTLPVSDVYLGEKPPSALRGIVFHPDGWLSDQRLASMQIAPRFQ